MDEENQLLYCSTNSNPDELIEYSINADASVTATGNRWPIPWQEVSTGNASASLEYDDCSQTFISINQDANAVEYFQIQSGNLVGTGSCLLSLGFGWGFGLDFASLELKVADIESLSCDFPVVSIEPDDAICGVWGDPLIVTFSSPEDSVWWHDDVTVDYSIRNTGEVTESFELTVNLDGYSGNPIVGPISLILGPGGELAGRTELPVPGGVSVNNTLCLEAGVSGSEPRASDCFDFVSRPQLVVEFDTSQPNVRRGALMPVEYLIRNQRSDASVSFRASVEQVLPSGEPDPANPLWGPAPMVLGPDGELSGNARWRISPNADFGGPYRLSLAAEPSPYTGVAVLGTLEYYVTP